MASTDAMQARMLADLGFHRRAEITEIDADPQGRPIDAATSRQKELMTERMLEDRKQHLKKIKSIHPDGALIEAWNKPSLDNVESTVGILPDRFEGQAHRANVHHNHDKEFHANVKTYGEERAIHMSQKRLTGPQGRSHLAAGTRNASGHRRAASPRSQGTARFAGGKITLRGQQTVCRTGTALPARPQQMPASAGPSRTPPVMSNGPIASRTRSKMSTPPKLASNTLTPSAKSRIKIFTTNKAVKTGPLPSEMRTDLQAKVTTSRTKKLPNYVRTEPRMEQPAADIGITNAWQDYMKAESTRGQSAISTTFSPASVYMPPLHVSLDVASARDTKKANDDIAAAQTLTISQLQIMCHDIERARLLECIDFIFDINSRTWLEENIELLSHFNYTGARLRREIMVVAQLPAEHPRLAHFLKEFGFVLQVQEHISAARLALDTVQCEDQASKEWFEANDQYLPFYKMALWIADNEPLEDYKADTDVAVPQLSPSKTVIPVASTKNYNTAVTAKSSSQTQTAAAAVSTFEVDKLVHRPVVHEPSTADEVPKSPANRFSSLYSSRFAPSRSTLVNAASSVASSTDESAASPRYTLSSRMATENQTGNSTESSIVNTHKPLPAAAAAAAVSACAAARVNQTQTPREILQVQESNGKRMQQIFDGKAMYRENGIWMFC